MQRLRPHGTSEIPKVETIEEYLESTYALAKYYTEKLAIQFSYLYDIDTVALRYLNVFDPDQDPDGEYGAGISKFTHSTLDSDRPMIYGDGEQSRDFTYINNVTQTNVLVAEGNATDVAVNANCGDRIKITEVVERINDVLDTGIKPIYDEPRSGDMRHSMAYLKRATEYLDYEPTTILL